MPAGCCEAAKTEIAKVTACPEAKYPASCTGGLLALPAPRPIVDDVRYFVEVPEIGSQEIAGEWLIPKDGILLVSFGPHTIADKDGKAVIRERLAIVEADEAEADAVGPAPAPRAAMWGPPAIMAAPIPAAPPMIFGDADPGGRARPAVPHPAAPAAAMPPMPSRSIPQGYHSDGKAADLPPLPPDEADHDEADDSAEPRPSPQTKAPRQQPAEVTCGQAPAHPPTPRCSKAQFTIPNLPTIPTLFQSAARRSACSS